MKSSAIFLLLLIIGSSFCALERNQGTLLNKSVKDTLSKSDLGRAIIGMVELGTTLGGSNLKGLFDALTRLKENILNSKQNEQTDFDSDTDAHNAEVDKQTGLIALYGGQITQFTEQLGAIDVARAVLDTDLANQKAQLTSAKQGVSAEEDLLKRLETSFNKEVENYNEVIKLLESAIAKLIEASGSADASKMVLVQTNAKSFENIAIMLQSSMNKVKAKIYMEPVIQLFMELSKKQAEITTDQIERAKSALVDLKGYYESGLNELNTQYTAEKGKHEDLIKTLKVQIGSLENQVIPKSETDIEASKTARQVKEGELADANSNKRQAEKNLKDENDSFEKRVEAHELLMPEYDAEFAVVVQAEQLIRNAAPSAFIEIDDE